jgi:hypothetical protein
MPTFDRLAYGYDPGIAPFLPLESAIEFRNSLWCFTGGRTTPAVGQLNEGSPSRMRYVRDTSKTNIRYERERSFSPAQASNPVPAVRVMNFNTPSDHVGYPMPMELFSGRPVGMTMGLVCTFPLSGRRVFAISAATDTPMMEVLRSSDSGGTILWRARRHDTAEDLVESGVPGASTTNPYALVMTINYVTGELWIKNVVTGEEDTSSTTLEGTGSPIYHDGRFRARFGTRSRLNNPYGDQYPGLVRDFHGWDGVEMGAASWYQDYLASRVWTP